jgi:hypothetical protein
MEWNQVRLLNAFKVERHLPVPTKGVKNPMAPSVAECLRPKIVEYARFMVAGSRWAWKLLDQRNLDWLLPSTRGTRMIK